MACVLVIATAGVLLQLPAVQKFAVRKTLGRIESAIDGRLELDGIKVQPFDAALISGLRIIDTSPTPCDRPQDTLFRADKIYADFTLRSLLNNGGLHMNRVRIENAMMALVIEQNEYKNNLSRIFRIRPGGKQPSEKELFSIRKVSVRNFEYRMLNLTAKRPPYRGYGIDWGDMSVTANIEGHSLRFADGRMHFHADHVDLVTDCGYCVAHISGHGRVGRGVTLVEDLHLIDNWSDTHLKYYKMSYSGPKSFQKFLDEVTIDAELEPGTLGFNTIAAYAGFRDMEGPTIKIAHGSMSGPVRDFTVQGLEFTELGSGASFAVEGRISGLPAIDGTDIDVKLTGSGLTTSGIDRLSSFARGQVFKLYVNARGPLNRLAVSTSLSDGAGRMGADMTVSSLTSGSPRLHGTITSHDLDLGKITGTEMLGKCSLSSGLEARFGKSGTSVRIDSLHIGRLGLMDYDYSNILAAGTFDNGAFNGRVVCSDPNLNFMLQGLVNLNRNASDAVYNFYASVGYADLHAMNIDSHPVSIVFLNNLRADFIRTGKGELTGAITARGLGFESQGGSHDIGDISIHSASHNGAYSMSLTSQFAEASYEGSSSIVDIVDEIRRVTIDREIPALSGSSRECRGNRGSLDFRFHDSRDLMAFIKPGMYIADSTHLTMDVSRDGTLEGRLTSPRIAFKDKYFRTLDLELDNKDNALSCKLSSNEISLMPSVNLRNGSLLLYANDNNLGLGCYYANDEDNRADIYLAADLSRNDADNLCASARTLTSNIYVNGERWSIRPAEATYNRGRLHLDGFRIENGDQSIALDGGISSALSDSLQLSIQGLELGTFNALLAGKYEMEGRVTGEALLTSPLGTEGLGLSANLTVEDSWLGGYPAGTLRAETAWNDDTSALDVMVSSHLDGSVPLMANGSFSPANNGIHAELMLNDFEAGYFSPLATSVFSALEGKVSGQFTIDGPMERMDIASSGAIIRNGLLQIGYTGVPYRLNGPFHIDNGGIHFDEIAFADSRNGTGTVSGGILYSHLHNMRMDTHLRFENMECTRMDERQDSPFYGNLYGTGRLSMTGPFNALLMDGDITTSSEGGLHIPLNAAAASGNGGLLRFKERERIVYIDPYEQMMHRLNKEQAASNSFAMRFRIAATPVVNINLEIDKASGHAFSGRGNGTVTLDVRPSNEIFTINGDYSFNSGEYHFSALGIANRDFTIQDGSSIKFNGDIMDSDLDINAQYLTKASLSSLIADTTSVSNRRNVECGIHISDKLRNPAMEFSINVPDLDPVTKSRVESALNTEDKIQKQFVALLISNNFLPDEQSGVTNNSANLLYSNMAEIMANQLNNILQKLDIPLDLGLNYQSTQSGMNIFDVAISTQLFNNRAIINGNIGNRQYGRSGSNEDVVGDIDIEIKLDRSGQVRLNLFSHSADDYTNYLDNSQRSGIGIAYQKEFNRFYDFLRRLFMSRKKRDAEDIEAAMRTEESILMEIN